MGNFSVVPAPQCQPRARGPRCTASAHCLWSPPARQPRPGACGSGTSSARATVPCPWAQGGTGLGQRGWGWRQGAATGCSLVPWRVPGTAARPEGIGATHISSLARSPGFIPFPRWPSAVPLSLHQPSPGLPVRAGPWPLAAPWHCPCSSPTGCSPSLQPGHAGLRRSLRARMTCEEGAFLCQILAPLEGPSWLWHVPG